MKADRINFCLSAVEKNIHIVDGRLGIYYFYIVIKASYLDWDFSITDASR